MTEKTSAVTNNTQAAIQAPLPGAPAIPGADTASAGAANTIHSAATDIAPAGSKLVSSAANITASTGTDVTTSLIVDGTLWVLIVFSVVTWTLILIKGIQHLRVSHYNRVYGKKFWGAQDFQAASELEINKGPAARVAGIGFDTLREADGGTTTHDLEHAGDRQELLDRRLRQQMQKERGSLESGLSILATIGSISPFVGLFGTVWGIMGALTNISKSGSASLEVVAGPIGEALIATAVGIAVAVPAVIGYNFFIRRNKVVWAYLDDFAIDFIHLALKTSFLIKRQRPNSAASSHGSEIGLKKPAPKQDQEDFNAEGARI